MGRRGRAVEGKEETGSDGVVGSLDDTGHCLLKYPTESPPDFKRRK